MAINGITLLDGGSGSTLMQRIDSKEPVWTFNVTHPELILGLHKDMAAAGAEYCEANTFSANRTACESKGYTPEQIIRPALELAHEALDPLGKKITLGVGPLTGLLKPFGTISEDECAELFREQISLGVAGKPDVIWIQTFMDLNMLEIAVKEAAQFDLPVFAAMSFSSYNEKKRSRTLLGNSVDQMLKVLKKYDCVQAVGINCSMSPDISYDIIKEFSEKSDMPLIYKPNAGSPKVEGGAEVDYLDFAKEVVKAASLPNVKYLGGCCGTTPEYIAALKDELSKLSE